MATQADSRLTTLKIVSYALVAIWLLIAAFPFLWTVWGSFKVQRFRCERQKGLMEKRNGTSLLYHGVSERYGCMSKDIPRQSSMHPYIEVQRV